MRQRTRLIVNALSNLAARGVAVGSRFLIVPFAIGVIGDSHYGVWIIVGQLLAYSRIAELGLRSAVARHVAQHLARGEHAELNRYVNTAAGFYSLLGAAIAAATLVVSAYFTDWFHVEPAYARSAEVMVLVSGLSLAITVPQYALGAVLAGLQRYDVISSTQVAGDVLRLILIFALLERFEVGGGMVLLAVAAGGTSLLSALARTAAAFHLCRKLTLRPWRMERSLLFPMATFGVNTVIYMMAATAAVQLAQIVIGATMSTSRATHFRLGFEMVLAIHVAMVACTVSVRVAASSYDGAGHVRMLRHLLIRSTRYAAILSLTGVVMAMVFSEPFLRLWQGENYGGAEGAATIRHIARACRILAIGFGLFWLSLPGFNVVNGMGRHRFPAVIATASAIVSMLLVVFFSTRTEATIESVAWGVTLPMIAVWTAIVPAYCCREVGVPLGGFLWRGLIVPTFPCAAMFLVALGLTCLQRPTTWRLLVSEVAVSLAVLAPAIWRWIVEPDDRAHMVELIVKGWRRFKTA